LFEADELYRELVLALRIEAVTTTTVTSDTVTLADQQQPEIAR